MLSAAIILTVTDRLWVRSDVGYILYRYIVYVEL